MSKASLDLQQGPAALDEISTMVELLRFRAKETPDRTAYVFLDEDLNVVDRYSYRRLLDKADMFGGRLAEEAEKGDRVLLLFPSGLDYIAAFFGCLLAGTVAVP